MNNRKTIRMTMLAAAMTAACAWATAQEITLYESHVLPEGLIFEPVDAMGMQASIDMIIKGPEDFHLRKSFKAGEPIEFSPATLGHGEMPDGTYRYELQIMGISGMTTDRDSDKPAITESLTGGYGAFSIRDGNLVSPGVEEASYKGETAPVGTLASSVQSPASQDGSDTRDQVIADDLIVTSSICVGFDCVNGESFGFDTLRLKENNLRIKFDDTSNSGSFPSNDWQLTANDSANGGANKFSIDDITGGRTPFTIEASAPSHSLYVDDGGRIGFGTSTPVVENHIVDGDSPTVRLEQHGSSGFTAQTWDIAGNETNFFVRDVTNGSTLPFRIRPGAPTSSIDIAADGDVGIGTTAPNGESQLHVKSNGANREVVHLERAGNVGVVFNDTTDANDWSMGTTGAFDFSIGKVGTGNVLIAKTNGDVEIPSGNIIVGGTTLNVPDYVFEPDYALLSIEEVSAFIDANGHLPGIASAQEVAEKGLNLTAMQLGMLEKVEELTLYTIQQQKVIKALEQRLAALEQKDR